MRKIINYLKYKILYNPLAFTKYYSIIDIPLPKEEEEVFEYYIEVLKYVKSLKIVQSNKKLQIYLDVVLLFIFHLRFNKKLQKSVRCSPSLVLSSLSQRRLDEGFFHLFNWRADEVRDGLNQPITGGFNKGQHLQRIIKSTYNSERKARITRR